MNTATDAAAPGDFAVNKVTLDAPWRWLAAGWSDLWQRPGISLGYGVVFVVVSVVLVGGLVLVDLSSLALALAAGFMLVGPLLAVGLYETSRRLETGEPITARTAALVATRSPSQLAFLGIILMLLLLAWVRIAMLLFALFFGPGGFPPLAEFVPILLFTSKGIGLLAVGSAIGGMLALLVFAISAVSVPMLMARDIDAITAVVTSVNAVRRNIGPMLLWGWLIVLLTAFGIATLFVGLIVTFPLVGHATWHAYRALVPD